MRFFKRFMGTSCLNYIKNLRLEKAAELLGQDGLPPLDASLSAANLLVFLLMWLVPTPLIAGMVNKY